MADAKITELTEDTSPTTDDLIVTVNSPASSPANRKVALSNLPISTPTQTALDLKSATSHNHTGVYAPVLGADDNYVTDAEKVVIGNTSGTNTGDQTLPVKATGTEINTGTNDEKFATPLAIANSDVAFLSDVTTKANTASPTFTGTVTLPTGGTSSAPLKFTSGTNLTTAEVGAMEYDGNVHYSTHAASARGVNTSVQFIRLTSAYTIPTEGVGLRAIFNSPTNGAVTLKGSASYQFELVGAFTSLSATSGSASFGFLGTASSTSLRYVSLAFKGVSTPSTCQISNTTTSSTTAITGATTGTILQCRITGVIAIDTGGTLIPAIGHSVVARPIVGVNTFFNVWPIGTDTVESVGNWS